MLFRVMEKVSEQCDVLAAVALDFVHAALFPPDQRLQAVARLADTEGLFAEVAECKSVAQALMDRGQHVEGWKRQQIGIRVTPQYFVIEANDVETDDEIRFAESTGELALTPN